MVVSLNIPAYAGVASVLSDWHPDVQAAYHANEVEADLEGEQQTLPEVDNDDKDNEREYEPLPTVTSSVSFSRISATVDTASKGITDGTDREYRRITDNFVAILLKLGLISSREEFLSATPMPETPRLIVIVIMKECDTTDLDGKPSIGQRSSYTHAQKMRAAMTYTFGRTLGLGSQAWQEYRIPGGLVETAGNPSTSELVSRYMISLRRRKAQSGETPTSARAITADLLDSLYDFNHRPENWDTKEYQPGSRKSKQDLDQWGGPLTRRAVQAIYTLAFLCLLRVDEVLRIRAEHIQTVEGRIMLTLPFRKTHQFGEIKPFIIPIFPDHEAHLCPVRALSDWMNSSDLIGEGFIFRRMASGDRINTNPERAMSSEQFLEIFRNNLIDIGVDPAPYGTHSFRRGGCQYLYSNRRWGLRKICEWGGWSTEFSNMTIVKYLISWNDDPSEAREDFFDHDRSPVMRCFSCGRSCRCI